VLNFFSLNVLLNHKEIGHLRHQLQGQAFLALVICVVVILLQACKMLGYVTRGLTRKYVTAKVNWLDWASVLLRGSVLIVTLRYGFEAKHDPAFCTVLGVVVGIAWSQLLVCARQVKSVGMRILPITSTMWDIGPFCAVLMVYLFGATNMYYSLDIHNSLWDCFLIIYRMVALADFTFPEIEGVLHTPELSIAADNATIHQAAREPTEYREVLQVMIVALTVVIGLSMMNLFIAMLCLSYSEAYARAPLEFMRTRADLSVDYHAMALGANSVCCCWRHRRVRFGRTNSRHDSSLGSRDSDTTQSTLDSMRSVSSSKINWRVSSAEMDWKSEAAQTAYLWHCCVKR